MTRLAFFLVVLVSMPVLAADYTPWSASNESSPVEVLLAQGTTGGATQRRTQPQIGDDYPGRYCCRHCRHDEVPCDGKCLVKKAGISPVCNKSAGCACPGKP